MTITTRSFPCGLALVLALSVVGCVHFDGLGEFQESAQFSDTLQVAGPVDLDVRTGAGRIFIDVGDSDRVEIFGEARANGWTSEDAFARLDAVIEAPPISQSGDRIRIGDNGPNTRNVWISYDIRVPAQTTIRATTGSGPIEIRGIEGAVESQTGSGSISIESIAGDVRAQTGSGRIDARDIGGSFRGGTGSGSVQLSLIAPGDVEVRTGSGRIEVDGVDGALRAGSGSGSVEVSGLPSGRWEVTTGSGQVRIEVPVDAGFELDAHAGSGRVDLASEFTIDRDEFGDDDSRERRLRGTVGTGGPVVEARTSSGGIRILPSR